MGWRFDVGFCVLVRFAALMGVVVFAGEMFIPKGIIRNGFPIVAELWILMWETS
jgi:hypothetical protein